MSNKSIKLLTIAFLSFIGTLFAETPCCESKEPECVICKDEALNLSAAYNAPARIDVKCPWNISVDGSFLYWQPREDGLEYAYVCPKPDSVDALTGHLAHLAFKYKPGFKVGLRWNTSHDHWVTDVHYTWLHSKMHDAVTIDPHALPGYYLQSLWLITTIVRYDHSLEISANWKFKLDLLDLNVSRPFYNGKKLSLTPFFGVKGGWIRQQYIVTGDEFVGPPSILISTNRSRSWLIGPRIGAIGDWLIGSGFRVFGNGAATLYYQQMTVRVLSPEIDHPENIQVNAHDLDKGQITPAFELGTGLGWGCYFCHQKWNFDLTASYDFNYFFRQNVMKTLNDDLCNSTYRSSGALALHGLTVTARFDF